MKKLLLFISVLTLWLTSCNNDDDSNPATPDTPDVSGNIEGRWEHVQQGTIVNGQEILTNYPHEQGCTKDFTDFLAGGILQDNDYYFNNATNTACALDVANGTWSRTGNMVTVSIDGYAETGEIMILNANTLKIKYTQQQGTMATTFVQVYKRIASNTAAAFEGSWEYSQEGVSANGTEVLQDYEHTPGCTKDYMVITTNTVTDHSFYLDNNQCIEDIYSATYTRNGNSVNVTVDGEVFTSEIVQLDQFTLKIKSTEVDQGQTVHYFTVYRRM